MTGGVVGVAVWTGATVSFSMCCGALILPLSVLGFSIGGLVNDAAGVGGGVFGLLVSVLSFSFGALANGVAGEVVVLLVSVLSFSFGALANGVAGEVVVLPVSVLSFSFGVLANGETGDVVVLLVSVLSFSFVGLVNAAAGVAGLPLAGGFALLLVFGGLLAVFAGFKPGFLVSSGVSPADGFGSGCSLVPPVAGVVVKVWFGKVTGPVLADPLPVWLLVSAALFTTAFGSFTSDGVAGPPAVAGATIGVVVTCLVTELVTEITLVVLLTTTVLWMLLKMIGLGGGAT